MLWNFKMIDYSHLQSQSWREWNQLFGCGAITGSRLNSSILILKIEFLCISSCLKSFKLKAYCHSDMFYNWTIDFALTKCTLFRSQQIDFDITKCYLVRFVPRKLKITNWSSSWRWQLFKNFRNEKRFCRSEIILLMS